MTACVEKDLSYEKLYIYIYYYYDDDDDDDDVTMQPGFWDLNSQTRD